MSIYGTYLNQNSSSVALANVPLCNYETFIESAIDCNYFFESILDRADLLAVSVVNEVEGDKPKFNIKESIDKMITKLQEMFNNFVGWVKKVMIEFKQKVKAWYEEHNIHKGLLKVALAGFSYDDIAAAQEKLENIEKYGKQNNIEGADGIMKDTSFPCGMRWITEFSLKSNMQEYSIEKFFEKEIEDCNDRIKKLKSMPAGDAKDEYEKLDKNISELKKRIDGTKNKDMEMQRDKYKDLERIKEKYNGYDSSYFDECLRQMSDIRYGMDAEKYFTWKKGQMISKSEFDELVKFVEDTVKRSNKIKDDDFWVKHCKRDVDDTKKYLECVKRSLSNKFELDYDIKSDYQTKTLEPEVKIDFTGAGYLYSAKLQVKMASLELNIATIALKNALTINKRLTRSAFSFLLGYRALCVAINKGYVNPDNPNKPSISPKQRKENLNKINSVN